MRSFVRSNRYDAGNGVQAIAVTVCVAAADQVDLEQVRAKITDTAMDLFDEIEACDQEEEEEEES